MRQLYTRRKALLNGGGMVENVISAWQFEDNANDSVGSNNGIATSVTYVTGKVGKAADFTSSGNAKIEVADAPDLSFGNGVTDSPFSISFFVQFAGFVSITNIVHKYKNPFEYLVEISGSGSTLSFFSRDNSAAANVGRKIDVTGFTTGVWYHIVCTCSGSGTTGGYEIYVDAVASSTGSVETGTYVAMENTTSPFFMGNNGNNANRSLNGFLDEVFLWDIELSQEQITDLYNDQNAGINILA